MTITLIHGTFAQGRRFPELEAALHQRFGATAVSTYVWSGWNSTRARLGAANRLVEQLRQLHGPHFLIGHSHGGSVALYAALKLTSQEIGGVASLNTPFVSGHRRRPWVRHAMPWICMWAASLVSSWIAWNVPGVSAAAYQLSHSLDGRGKWILQAVIMACFGLGYVALKRGERRSRELSEQLDLRRAEDIPMLVIRRAGDEATAALGALYTLDWIINRCAQFLMFGAILLLLLYLFVFSVFVGPLLQLPGQGLAAVSAGLVVIAALIQGVAYGPEHAWLLPWIYCTADFSPPGRHQTLNLKGTDDSELTTRGLFHSVVNDQRTVEAVVHWIEQLCATAQPRPLNPQSPCSGAIDDYSG